MRYALRGCAPVLLLGLLQACATARPVSAQEQALSSLRQRPGWLFAGDPCPADVIPAVDEEPRPLGELCASNLPACLDSCQQGDGGGCYWGALRVQHLGHDNAAAEALFLRACRLGVMSGCTNRAAGMLVGSPADAAIDRCAARTFELTCQADDPWGCTMLGDHLYRGKGLDRDLRRARRVLNQACRRHGREDPACAQALRLLEQLDKEEKGLSI